MTDIYQALVGELIVAMQDDLSVCMYMYSKT